MADRSGDENNVMSKVTASGFLEILKKSAKAFKADKIPKISASLAFYTIFSLGPMLIVVLFLSNVIWGQQAIDGMIGNQLEEFVGKTAALQIQQIIKHASIDTDTRLAATVGIITLFIGSTTVFAEIQDSINMIWNLKVKSTSGWWRILLSRIISFSIVVTLGFLLLVSLIANALLEGFMQELEQMFPETAVILIYSINLFFTLFVTAILFGLIFKVLPDAHVRWKDVLTGAIFTAILFMLTRFGITFYIGKSDIGSSYGAAGSLVVLLVWIYLSSMILYFGAEFTKFYAIKFGSDIKPNAYTVTVQNVQQESRHRTVQENEEEIEDRLKKKT